MPVYVLCWLFFNSSLVFGAEPDSVSKDRALSFDTIQWVIDNETETLPSHLIQGDSAFVVKNAEAFIAREFHGNGFFNAVLDSVGIVDDALVMYSKSNCQFRLAEIEFYPENISLPDYLSFFKSGANYSDQNLEEEIVQIITALEREGYLTAKVVIDEIRPIADQCLVQVSLEIDKGDKIYASDVRFNGIEKTDPNYLKTVTGLRDSVLVNPEQLRIIRRNLMNTNYFSFVSEADIVKSSNDYYLAFTVEEQNLNQFDAIIGYVPQPDNSNTIVGTADLRVRNVGWQGSILHLSFERLQQLTTKLDMGYEKDWVASLPLGLGGSFDFIQQDTTYQIRNIRVQGSYYLNSNTRLSLGLRREATSSNQNPMVQALVLNGTAHFAGVGLRYDNTDRRISPQNGLRARIFFESGFKNTDDDRAEEFNVTKNIAQQEINMDIRYFISPIRRQVLATRLNAYFMESPQFTESDLTRFGGARSFRGYREDQFRASRLIWGDMEYRYLLDPTSYAFVFGAYGVYNRPVLITESIEQTAVQRNLYSYGFGFSYNTPIGFVQFTYALSDEDDISNGKIHFGIISEF